MRRGNADISSRCPPMRANFWSASKSRILTKFMASLQRLRSGCAVAVRHAILCSLSIAEKPAAGSARRSADGLEAPRVQPDLSERTNVRLLAAGVAARRRFFEDGLCTRGQAQDGAGH